MTDAWCHLRRLVASIMLVAVASFVLHGSALASFHRHAAAAADCAGHAHPPSGHTPAAEWSVLDPADHLHRAAEPGLPAAAGDHHDHAAGGGEAPCCGKVCAVALRAEPPAVGVQPAALGRALLSRSQLGSGLGPTGLKRPPRTSGIA